MISMFAVASISLAGSLLVGNSTAFTAGPLDKYVRATASHRSTPLTASVLFALTERQLQFWEDVDEGVEDIAAYYEPKGHSLDRIRQFSNSARGESQQETVEGLTAKPFWDATSSESFPWAKELEANAGVIIEELEAKLVREAAESNEKEGLFSGDSAWQSKVMGAGWSAFRLQRLGAWNFENVAEFPRTYELLQRLNIPLAVRGVCFARQAPGSGVAPHTDGRNFILTSHLGLKVPTDCWIKVGDETRTWEEGKLTTLDTSFEHSTGNDSDSDRHILIIDFWHPELSEAEKTALTFVYDLRNRFERGEVPFRKPRKVTNQDDEQEVGLMSIWKAITGEQ